mgnify:CR=1 FL=1
MNADEIESLVKIFQDALRDWFGRKFLKSIWFAIFLILDDRISLEILLEKIKFLSDVRIWFRTHFTFQYGMIDILRKMRLDNYNISIGSTTELAHSFQSLMQ